jgi:hypothetical protein
MTEFTPLLDALRKFKASGDAGFEGLIRDCLSLSETQSCWQLISNRAMLLPYASGLLPNLVGVGRSVPVAGLA